jgi:putative pyruvate formate lyase activating enzyme
MPDFKFWTRESSLRLLKAKDYPERAREAIQEMHRQVGLLRFGSDGTARRGVLVRHLVMPGKLDETNAIFRWLADEVSIDTFVNILAQYRPQYKVGTIAPHGEKRYDEINRSVGRKEIAEAYELARDAGLWRFDERF